MSSDGKKLEFLIQVLRQRSLRPKPPGWEEAGNPPPPPEPTELEKQAEGKKRRKEYLE
jgi:hypothetical protein